MNAKIHRVGLLAGFLLVSSTLQATDEPAPTAGNPPATAPGLLDQFRQGFAHTLDQSARWVDGLFGEEHYTNAGKGANGRLRLRAVWQEYAGTKVRSQLRANLPLDNLSHRLNAFVGKGSVNDVLEDKNQSPVGADSGKDNEWLVGLGYTPSWTQARHITFQAGAILSWPPDAYVRANYRYRHVLSEGKELDFRESLFWKESEQLGFSSSLDFSWRLRDDLMLRFPNWAKISGATEGVEYDSRAQLYQNFRGNRALLYGFGVQGDTREAVPIRQYGAYVVYRQRMLREWFTGELIAGATMLRENSWTERKFSLVIGIGCELSFEEKGAVRDSAVASQLLGHRRSR